jgi:hypothetical protein
VLAAAGLIAVLALAFANTCGEDAALAVVSVTTPR